MAKARKNQSKRDLEAKREAFSQIAVSLEKVETGDFLKTNYLPYAWSIILDRALVDTTGLKPVQRRILYVMSKRGLKPTATRQKVATLAGATLAYHPHGDASVEEALKNLARPHIFRVPMIDGRGDFGAPGTPGAAGRYIEARLSPAGWLNVVELAENAVEMAENYDNTDLEPLYMPVRFPVGVINGTSGISAGYASNIPSHNPSEIMSACRKLLKNPEMTGKQLMRTVKGPDFNMGGTIVGDDGIREYFETGGGTFRIRANYEVKPLPRGKTRIDFYEIPYGTAPETIIEQITAKTEKQGLFKNLASYKDLSDLEHPILVSVETKGGVQYEQVLADLFEHTSLESSFSANITTIVDNRPVKTGIKPLLLDFIEFRKRTVFNKMLYRKEQREKRLHLVEGLLLVLLDIDRAVEVIKSSNNAKTAKNNLMREFKIDENQAEHVLSLQLRRLTRMDSRDLKTEEKSLKAELKEINKILTDETAMVQHLDAEFAETAKIIGDERKTTIITGSEEALIEKEEAKIEKIAKEEESDVKCVVYRYADGKIAKIRENSRAKSLPAIPVIDTLKVGSQETLLLVNDDGIGYKVPVGFLPWNKPVTAQMAGMTGILAGVSIAGKDLALFTKQGTAKIMSDKVPLNSDSFPVITLNPGDKVANAEMLEKAENTYFVFITASGMIGVFDADTVSKQGRTAKGVAGAKIDADDEVIWFQVLPKDKAEKALIYSRSDKSVKITKMSEIPTAKNRGGKGVILQRMNKGESGIDTAYISDSLYAYGKNGKAVELPEPTPRAKSGELSNLKPWVGEKSM